MTKKEPLLVASSHKKQRKKKEQTFSLIKKGEITDLYPLFS